VTVEEKEHAHGRRPMVFLARNQESWEPDSQGVHSKEWKSAQTDANTARWL